MAVNRKILHERIVHLVTHYVLCTEGLVRHARSGQNNVAVDGHWSVVALSDGVVEVRALVEAETHVAEHELVGHINKAKDTSHC